MPVHTPLISLVFFSSLPFLRSQLTVIFNIYLQPQSSHSPQSPHHQVHQNQPQLIHHHHPHGHPNQFRQQLRRPASHQYLSAQQLPHSPQLSPMHLQINQYHGLKSQGLLSTFQPTGGVTLVSHKYPLPTNDSATSDNHTTDPNNNPTRSPSPSEDQTNEIDAAIGPSSTNRMPTNCNSSTANRSPIGIATSIGRSAVPVVPNQYVEMFIV